MHFFYRLSIFLLNDIHIKNWISKDLAWHWRHATFENFIQIEEMLFKRFRENDYIIDRNYNGILIPQLWPLAFEN